MADDALVLRRLIADDLPAYKALRDGMLDGYPEAFTSDAEAEAAKPATAYLARLGTPPLEDDRPDGRFTLGAWREGVLVGAVTCDRDARVKVRHIGNVVGMMVRPDRQGDGIGRRLLAACIAEARRAPDLEMLTLSVTAGNHGAVGLYRRAGFERYGSLPAAIKVGTVYHAKDLMVLQLHRETP